MLVIQRRDHVLGQMQRHSLRKIRGFGCHDLLDFQILVFDPALVLLVAVVDVFRNQGREVNLRYRALHLA